MDGPGGVYVYSDGRRYEGSFQGGKPHGPRGKGWFADGRLFHEGPWEAGAAVKRNGKGRLQQTLLAASSGKAQESTARSATAVKLALAMRKKLEE